MADNRLKAKAIANYHSGMGWYTGDAEEAIYTSPENRVVIKGQQPNPKRKHVKVGKALVRIKGT